MSERHETKLAGNIWCRARPQEPNRGHLNRLVAGRVCQKEITYTGRFGGSLGKLVKPHLGLTVTVDSDITSKMRGAVDKANSGDAEELLEKQEKKRMSGELVDSEVTLGGFAGVVWCDGRYVVCEARLGVSGLRDEAGPGRSRIGPVQSRRLRTWRSGGDQGQRAGRRCSILICASWAFFGRLTR